MSETTTGYEPITFDAIRIGLASPKKTLEWSHGEAKKPETISYRTLEPEKDGLFCERIFGPSKDWECHCGRYKKIRYKGVICDRYGVEVTKASVRGERMGHISLAVPVSHIWYFKSIPSRMGLIPDLSPRILEKILYSTSYVVLDDGDIALSYKQILSEKEFREAEEQYGDNAFRAGMGAEAVLELSKDIDLEKESEEMQAELETVSGQKRVKLIKHLEVVESFRKLGNRPEWMILTVVPVIPPDIRPMVQLDGGRSATSNLNDLYRRIINRNNHLAHLLTLGAPDIIVRNEERMLQEAVNALIDNGRRGRPVTGPGNRALKSLPGMPKGKQGRFRQNLLGKRVDYSGRSVTVVGPGLKTYQCGLPKEMAIKLFKPLVMKELVENGAAHDVKSAKKMVEHMETAVWDVLEDAIKEHPVTLNRTSMLHHLSIQAFEPILVEGKAIKLHPLVCTALNADFDGNQMAVHLPLSVEAQSECRFLMLSPNNLSKSSDSGPVVVPPQDMVLGIYYLTQQRDGVRGEGMLFKSPNEALLAYANHEITLQTKIKVRFTKKMPDGTVLSEVQDNSVGRILFNEIAPQDLSFVDRSKPENALKPEIDLLVKKKQCKQILEKVINVCDLPRTAEVLDDIKAIDYKYSTIAGMTVPISDMTVPATKKKFIAKAQARVEEISKNPHRGLTTDEGRYEEVIKTWQETDRRLTKDLLEGLDQYNNIFMMADSGARGSDKRIKQLAGMQDLMADTTSRAIELPITSNFREGLDVLEYFISTHGIRKGLSDTVLRTADSGYLTRRLVDVSQDLIVREVDCSEGKEIPNMEIKAFMDGKGTIEGLQDGITGRYIAEDIVDPDTGEIAVKANRMVTPKRTEAVMRVLEKTGRTSVKIRTILACKYVNGICAECYGANMTIGQVVQVGEAVGIIVAQSIGEPGMQPTMRAFHTGGVADGDITQGLPRAEELFEARKPKGLAIIAEIPGVVEFRDTKKKREIIVTNPEDGSSKTYLIPYSSHIVVSDGQRLEAGDELTSGSLNPHDVLRIKGVRAVQDYMLREVQRVYRLQGVEINDKHIEVIVRQILKKIHAEDAGDAGILLGINTDVLEFNAVNEELIAEDKTPAEGKQIMLDIAKASLTTDSFFSAASFQETAKVLTEAAISGKTDHLISLKENVIISKLTPAGTDTRRYRNVKLDTDVPESEAVEEILDDDPAVLDIRDEIGETFPEEETHDAVEHAVEELTDDDADARVCLTNK